MNSHSGSSAGAFIQCALMAMTKTQLGSGSREQLLLLGHLFQSICFPAIFKRQDVVHIIIKRK